MKVSINAIKGVTAYRASPGNIQKLAQSIHTDGLLHPVIITKEDVLISGSRRIAASTRNGKRSIDAVVPSSFDELFTLLEAEQKNALHALPLSIIGTVHQARLIMSQRKQKSVGFQARERLSTYLGFSDFTLRRADYVVDAAERLDTTEEVKAICREMNESGNINRAYTKLHASGGIILTDRVKNTITNLKEQRTVLGNAAVKARGLASVLSQIESIHAQMAAEEKEHFIAELSAGRTALTKIVNTIRKAQDS